MQTSIKIQTLKKKSENFPIIQKLKLKKRKLLSKPQKMLSVYFKHDKNNNALSNIIKELRKLNKFVHTKDFDEYSFIGSSILFVFDNTTHKRHNVSVNIIDFKRYRQSKKLSQNAKKYRNSFRIGVSNLLKEFIKYKI